MPLTELDLGEEPTDVIVMGGGVIGLGCTETLVKRGLAVRLLERGNLGAGASHGNCGIITPSHALPLTAPGMLSKVLRSAFLPSAPIYVKPRLDLAFLSWGLRFARRCNQRAMLEAMRGRAALLNRSRELYDDWIREWGLDCEWETQGMIEVFATERAMTASADHYRILDEHGVHSQAHLGEDLQRLEPALLEGLHGGQHFPRDAHLRPDRLVAELGRVVRAGGALVNEGSEVVGVEQENGQAVVRTSAATFRAGHAILAAGVWSPSIGRQLGLRLPIQPGKGYSLTYERPAICPRYPLILGEANAAVTPWRSGFRVGGTMEFSGFDTRLNEKRLDAVRRGAARYLRQSEGDGEPERWCGFRPMTPDELPIIDRVPRWPAFVVAAGHGMMGVSMAPATAELVADLVQDRTSDIDRTPYALR